MLELVLYIQLLTAPIIFFSAYRIILENRKRQRLVSLEFKLRNLFRRGQNHRGRNNVR